METVKIKIALDYQFGERKQGSTLYVGKEITVQRDEFGRCYYVDFNGQAWTFFLGEYDLVPMYYITDASGRSYCEVDGRWYNASWEPRRYVTKVDAKNVAERFGLVDYIILS